MEAEKLMKKYGKRYAYEWFVRAEDDFHFRLAKNYTDSKCRKITAIAGTNAVINIVLLIALIYKHLKFQ